MFIFTRDPCWCCCWCLGLSWGRWRPRVVPSLELQWYSTPGLLPLNTAYQEVTVLRPASPLLKKCKMQPQPEARLRPSRVENLGFNLITFRLTENTLAATLEWSAKALYCTFVSRSTDSAEAGRRSLNAIGYWIMETGVAPTIHNSVYTFSWSMKLKDSW